MFVRLPNSTNLIRGGLVFLAIAFSISVGFSGHFFQGPKLLLCIMGAIVASMFTIIFLHNPVRVLYLAILVGLLPRQILLMFPIQFITNYMLLLCLLLALICWFLSVIIHHRKTHWPSTNLVMLAFLAWCFITLFWAPNPVFGRQALAPYIVGFALLLLVVNEIDSRQALNGLMITIAVASWLTVLASIETVLVKGYTPGERLEVLGINENALGIALLVSLPSLLWLAMKPEGHQKTLRMLIGAVFLLFAIGVCAMSGSRGSIISFLVTLLAFMFWKPTRFWGVLGLSVLALGAAFSPFLFSTTLERFAVVQGDTMLGGREAIWQAAMRFILDHPWGGAGIGNGSYEVMTYLRSLTSILGYERSSMHNPVLQVWADTGILGILLYLGILVSAVWSFARQYAQCRKSGEPFLTPYFALVTSVFLGYLASWIKGGGIEASFIHFLILSLLLIPACLHLECLGKQRDSSNEIEATPYIV